MPRVWPASPQQMVASQPVNWRHPLAQELRYWWLVVPERAGGTLLYDLAQRANGTLTNMASPPTSTSGWSQDGRQGGRGHLAFDGTNDYVNAGTLDVTTGVITLAGWMYVVAFAGLAPRMIDKSISSASADHWWMLGTVDSSGNHWARTRIRAGGSVTTLVASTGPIIPLNTWFHLAVTYDGATIELYYNGQPIINTAKTGTLDTDASVSVNLGRNAGGADSTTQLNGRLDDVRVYARALRAGEIEALYLNSLVGFPGLLQTASIGRRAFTTGGAGIAIAETLTLEETRTARTFLFPSPSDQLTLAEVLTPGLFSFPFIAEPVTVGETVTQQVLVFPTSTEALTVDDSASLFVPFLAPISTDSVVLNDPVLLTLLLFPLGLDAVTVDETILRTLLLFPAVSETVTVGETTLITVGAMLALSVTDALTVDALSTVRLLLFPVAVDALTVEESTAVTLGNTLALNVTDILTLDDSLAVLLLLLPVIADDLSVAETTLVVVGTTLALSITDAVTLGEQLTLDTLLFPRPLEALTVEDATTLDVLLFPREVEALTLGEQLALRVPFVPLAVVDTLTVSEEVTFLGGALGIVIAESVTVNDVLAVMLSLRMSPVDILSVGESTTARLLLLPSVAETLPVTQSVSLNISMRLFVADVLTLEELTKVSVAGYALVVAVIDSFTLSEAVSVQVYVLRSIRGQGDTLSTSKATDDTLN